MLENVYMHKYNNYSLFQIRVWPWSQPQTVSYTNSHTLYDLLQTSNWARNCSRCDWNANLRWHSAPISTCISPTSAQFEATNWRWACALGWVSMHGWSIYIAIFTHSHTIHKSFAAHRNKRPQLTTTTPQLRLSRIGVVLKCACLFAPWSVCRCSGALLFCKSLFLCPNTAFMWSGFHQTTRSIHIIIAKL